MRGRWPLLWLALYRRRTMLIALLIGMIAFEALIVVVADTITPRICSPREARARRRPTVRSADRAAGCPSPVIRGCSAPGSSTRSGSPCS